VAKERRSRVQADLRLVWWLSLRLSPPDYPQVNTEVSNFKVYVPVDTIFPIITQSRFSEAVCMPLVETVSLHSLFATKHVCLEGSLRSSS
jgi:hypothetical protein